MRKPKSKPKPKETVITLPPKEYQPSKAELEKEYDMPGLSLEKLRQTFFRPVKVLRRKK